MASDETINEASITTVGEIRITEAYGLPLRELPPEVDLILDCREHDDLGDRHIPNAVHIPYSQLLARKVELPPRHYLPRVQEPSQDYSGSRLKFIAPKDTLPDTVSARLLRLGYYSSPVTPTMGHHRAGASTQPQPHFWKACHTLVMRPPRSGHYLRALDMGCGSGRDLAWLSGRGWRVVGVDRDQWVLDQARGLVDRLGVGDRVELIAGNVRDHATAREVRDKGPYDLLLVSRFPFSSDLFPYLAGLLAPNGLLYYHQFHISASEIAGKPRAALCVKPDVFTSFASLPLCSKCALSPPGGCVLRRDRKCGLGLTEEDAWLTACDDGRYMYNWVGRKGID
eukprot:gnl/Dysnectes_brevis/7435_a12439_227.p1 GENE.gnl/Dysnectes_brevis/7435_a12439_227~~gnl/Dysnectes_brevis/7435_a12439_227.p1  ORF type:complete len:340 (-),score=36.22 gnl/Dysnectes_brevis/7435_a12439_227:228-1247(-)